MVYADQWKALAARIRGLVQAAQLDAWYLTVRSSDTYGRSKHLRRQAEAILNSLRDFQEDFHEVLPPVALTAIDDCLTENEKLIRDVSGGPNALQERVWAAMVRLAAFEAEMSFILADVQESVRARSELAFAHLQRLIFVDPEFRGKWECAYKEGETACEKLGAVHLLHHGIWAFKVNALKASTDLVLQEPLERFAEQQRHAHGLVLTEWKRAKPEGSAEARFAEARDQAALYAGGVMHGVELRSHRYAIVVSRGQVPVPTDLSDGGIVYRHINIAVAPMTPSRAVRTT